MTKPRHSPFAGPPLTGTPLDYVPIDAPRYKITAPTRFRVPTLKRALVAAVSVPLLAVAVPAGLVVFGVLVAVAAMHDWLDTDDAQ